VPYSSTSNTAKKASEIIPESGKQNIKGCEISFSAGNEEKFAELQEEFLAFKKRMSANRDNKKKGKRGQFKGKDKRGGERRTRVPQGKRTTFNDSDDEATPAKVEKKEEAST